MSLVILGQILGIILLAIAGAKIGQVLAQKPRAIWLGGFILLMLPLLLIGLARKLPQLEFMPPCLWLMAGRSEFVVLAFLIPALLGIPAALLPLPRQRLLVQVLGGLCVCSYSVFPFLMPALHRSSLQKLQTSIDRDGVCLQGTGYTCGPSASVTALHRLGVRAEEAALALTAHSSLYSGTPPDSLCVAIDELYGSQGVTTEFRYCATAEELQLPAVALLKWGTMTDHYVAVLSCSTEEVVVGDPLHGKVKMPRATFDQRWRHCAIFFKRKSSSADRR